MKRLIVLLSLLLSIGGQALGAIDQVGVFADAPYGLQLKDSSLNLPAWQYWKKEQWYWTYFFRSNDAKSIYVTVLPAGKRFDGWYTMKEDDTSTYGERTTLAACTNLMTTAAELPVSTIESQAKTTNWEMLTGTRQYVISPRFSDILFGITFSSAGEAGVSGSVAPITGRKYGDSITLPNGGFTRPGYTSVGWTNVTGTVFANGATVSGSAFWVETSRSFDGALYPKWEKQSYDLTYDPVAAGPARVEYEQVFAVTNLTKTGYDFRGWTLSGVSDTARWAVTSNHEWLVIDDDVPCLGNKGLTWFKRLSSTADATVGMTARFSNSTYTVRLVNNGGSSTLESTSVRYDLPYNSLSSVPTYQEHDFLGYFINGKKYWDEKGFPVQELWDVASNCDAVAQWELHRYTRFVSYDGNEGEGEIASQVVTNGCETVLSDGTGFTRLGCPLLGWARSASAQQPEFALGAKVSFEITESTPAEIVLYAVWEIAEYVGFDGFGATSGVMEPQKFLNGETKELSTNAYAKTGYSFGGWAETEEAARALKPTYADHQFYTEHVEVAGSTNWLYAVWQTNAYYVAYDANGGAGTLPPVQACKYDAPVMLPDWNGTRAPFRFAGWSNVVEGVAYTNLPVTVSNLCATAGGTNTLQAIWRLSDLSEAMHCTNLWWASSDEGGRTNPWTAIGGLETSARQTGLMQYAKQQYLTATVAESGALSFRWTGKALRFCVKGDEWIQLPEASTPQEFQTNLFCLAGSSVTIRFYNYGVSGDDADIYRMSWTPGPVVPPYVGEDEKVDAFAVSAGAVSLTFTGPTIGQRYYHILGTNDVTAPMPWPWLIETNVNKQITIDIPRIEGEPKMFYRVRAIAQ